MRGRKTDSIFVSNFITNCVSLGKVTPEDILQEAKNQINIIDEKIKEVEKIKVNRAKLLDVIAAFDRPAKPNKSEEIKILNFFKLQRPEICKHICQILSKTSGVRLKDVCNLYSEGDVIFCIKQLIEHKIIVKKNDVLDKGDSFADYWKFINHED